MGGKAGLLALLVIAVMIFTAASFAYAGTTELVSVSSTGEGGNCYSHTPSISYDGRYIAFNSCADNLVADDTNGTVNFVAGYDVFVHDRETGITKRVSVDSNGHQADYNSEFPSISGNGRYVAFSSRAENLVPDGLPDDNHGGMDVFVHDLQTGVTEVVSFSALGYQSGAESCNPDINYDGRYVAFESRVALVPGISNYMGQIYVHDRTTGVTECASIDSNGNPGDMNSSAARISGDGRFVVFWSLAGNLVPDDQNNAWDIFIRDMATGLTERIPANAGADFWGPSGGSLSINYDGRYITFSSSVYDRPRV